MSTMHTVAVIHPDGSLAIDDRSLDLDTLQAIVGGYIEEVPISRGEHGWFSLIVHAEGRLIPLPVNEVAAVVLADLSDVTVDDLYTLHGPVVIVGSDTTGEWAGLCEEYQAQIREVWDQESGPAVRPDQQVRL